MIPTANTIDANLKLIYDGYYKRGHYFDDFFVAQDGEKDLKFGEFTGTYMYEKHLLSVEYDSTGHKMYTLSEFGVEVIERHENWSKYLEFQERLVEQQVYSEREKESKENELKSLQKEKLEYEQSRREANEQLQELTSLNLKYKLGAAIATLISGIIGVLLSDWIKDFFRNIWNLLQS